LTGGLTAVLAADGFATGFGTGLAETTGFLTAGDLETDGSVTATGFGCGLVTGGLTGALEVFTGLAAGAVLAGAGGALTGATFLVAGFTTILETVFAGAPAAFFLSLIYQVLLRFTG
jgi:hypothetical protein